VEAALARTPIKLQRSLRAQQQAQQRKLNEGSLIILAGFPGTPYFEEVHDIAAALDGSDGLRLIGVDAAGGIGSLQDLLQDLMLLRGIDLALVPANAREK
jgi:hypothetical protein